MKAVRANHRAGYRTSLGIRIASPTMPHQYATPAQTRAWVKRILGRWGRYIDEIEIGNEPNLPIDGPADGRNPDAVADVVAGVIPAKRWARHHRPSMEVGFNWIFLYHGMIDAALGHGGPGTIDDAFFSRLKAAASPEFLRSIDFLGVHTYPNTLSLSLPVDDDIERVELDALQTARCYMGYLGLSRRVPIHITEVGYATHEPTDGDVQADYWRRVLSTVYAYRHNFNVRSVSAFLFRDVTTDAPGYGLVDRDNNPKPAYDVVTDLMRRYGPRQ